MTKEDLLNIYREIDNKLLEISEKKGNDYANEDMLSVFKTVSKAAELLGIDIGKSEQFALFMVLLKIARITNLINNNKNPNNESIEDSFIDGINYFKLAYCCYEEKKLENN